MGGLLYTVTTKQIAFCEFLQIYFLGFKLKYIACWQRNTDSGKSIFGKIELNYLLLKSYLTYNNAVNNF